MNPANVAAAATMEHPGWPVTAKAYSARKMTAGAGSRHDGIQSFAPAEHGADKNCSADRAWMKTNAGRCSVRG
jgi:hypothetical protein